MDLSKEQMKERVINYLEYMEEKDLQEKQSDKIMINEEESKEGPLTLTA